MITCFPRSTNGTAGYNLSKGTDQLIIELTVFQRHVYLKPIGES